MPKIAPTPPKIIRVGTVHKTRAFTGIDQSEYVPKVAKRIGSVES